MTAVHPSLEISREQLAAFCEKWQIHELYLFGSAARGELRPESDIDVMVEFEESAHGGLFGLIRMKNELAELLHRPVDVLVKGTVENPYRRASIERDLTLLYAA